MKDTNNHKSAVILSGGGGDGAFEVGVMKALLTGQSPSTGYQPLDPYIYSGSSVGSYSGAFIVSRTEAGSAQAVGELEAIWVNKIGGYPQQCGNGVFRFRGGPIDFLNPACLINHPLQPFFQLARDSVFLTGYGFAEAAKFTTSPEPLEQRILNSFNLTAFVDIERYKQLIRETIDFGRIRQSDTVLRVASTNWKTGRLNIFGNEDMTEDIGFEIIRGSSAIPGFFPPAIINGVRYVDAGLLLTTPLSPAIRAGADTLHIIFLDPRVEDIPVDRLQSTLSIFSRMYVILTAAQFRNDIASARSINRGLEIVEKISSGVTLSEEESAAFTPVLEQIERQIARPQPYKKLTIHAYRPGGDLGGLIGLLDFSRKRMIELIQRGFKNAVEHDCETSGCILPDQTEPQFQA